MDLKKCPKCGVFVLSKAKKCPRCAYKIKKMASVPRYKLAGAVCVAWGVILIKLETKFEMIGLINAALVGVLALVLGILLLIITYSQELSGKENQDNKDET